MLPTTTYPDLQIEVIGIFWEQVRKILCAFYVANELFPNKFPDNWYAKSWRR